MEVTLTSEAERAVADMVQEGRFGSPTEAVAAAVLRLQTEQALAELDPANLDALRAKVAEGLEAARRGDLSDGDEFFEQLERDDQPGSGRKTA